jgi:OTT_1508-like deaminase
VAGNRPTHGVANSKVPVLQRQISVPLSRSVVQRAERKFAFTKEDLNEDGLLTEAMEWEDLSEIAIDLNKAASPEGLQDGRHVQAVTLEEGGHMKVFTQKWATKMGDVIIPDVFGMEDKDYVKRNKKDNHLHAEMLAISSFLQGKAKLPEFIGVSKPVCARCSVVLDYFKIAHFTDGNITDNWVSPWYHAKKNPPKALKGKIPKTVRDERVFLYKEADWR